MSLIGLCRLRSRLQGVRQYRISRASSSSRSDSDSVRVVRRGGEHGGGIYSEQSYRASFDGIPRAVFLCVRPDRDAHRMGRSCAQFIRSRYGTRVYVEDHSLEELADTGVERIPRSDDGRPDGHFEAIIAVGGDGTMLHAARMCGDRVPPILGIDVGSLGFLMPFPPSEYREAIGRMFEDEFILLDRMQLRCSVVPSTDRDGDAIASCHDLLNEVTLHRCAEPGMAVIDCRYNGYPFTQIIGDGVTIATPTGSTGYSKSTGGLVTHPLVAGMLFTPVAPQSLSSRAVVLPAQSVIELEVRSSSVTITNRECMRLLQCGDRVRVEPSPNPVPTIARSSVHNDWLRDMQEKLLWNRPLGSGRRGP